MDAVLEHIWLTPFLLARVLVFIRVLPFMGSNVLPPLVVTAFSFTFAPLLLPLFTHQMPDQPVGLLLGGALILKEMLLGFLFAFVAGLFFWAIMSMGFLMDNQRGSSQGDTSDPLSQEQTSPFGAFFFQWTTLLFCSSGALTIFLGSFLESYMLWPIFSPVPPADINVLAMCIFEQLSRFCMTFLVLSAPIVAIFFLTDFSLGLVNRFAQQLNVFILSMPIKSAIMLILLVFYVSILQGVVLEELARLPYIFQNIHKAW